jgi:hypothetical protein
MKANIATDEDFDAAEAVDAQRRTLLTIAEGNDANSRLSKVVLEMFLFLELYKIQDPPAHKSKTCIVPLAEDYSDPNAILPEALKFMCNEDQFERELSEREGLDERYVIGVIRYYNSKTDSVFAAAIKSFHNGVYAEYPYCIVLPRANRALHEVISHDHIAGVPERILDVKVIVRQIAEALQHFHYKGIIHAVRALPHSTANFVFVLMYVPVLPLLSILSFFFPSVTQTTGPEATEHRESWRRLEADRPRCGS